MAEEEQKKELPSRASRGKRMSALLDEENEADESFWNQEYFKEEAEDTVYEQQEEEEDVVDDDFDLPENDVFEPEEDEETAKKKEKQTKKKSVYVDPKGQAAIQKEKKRQKRTIKPKVKEIESDDDYSEYDSDELEEEVSSKADGKETPKTDRQMRDSTKTLSMEKKVARERRQRELQRRRAERGPRRRTYHRKISQKDLLEETKITEEINKASLEILLAIEEERKKLPQLKTTIQGPVITFYSKDGQSSVTFSDKIPDVIKQKPQEYPPKMTCVITGLPAKYVDPKTGLPYATIPAFKQLRQQYGHIHPTELPRSIYFPKPVPEPEPIEPEPTPMPMMIEEPVLPVPQIPIKKKKEHKRKKKKDKYYDFYP